MARGMPATHIIRMPRDRDKEKRIAGAAWLFLAGAAVLVLLALLKAYLPWWGRP
jgi:hypothetical protein